MTSEMESGEISQQRVPLFPLSSVVMPDGLLPLRIFETRYVDMVSNCMRQSTGFVVCAIVQGGEVGEPAVPSECGCQVGIVDFDQDEQGLLTIVTKGERKVRISEVEVLPSQLQLAAVEPMEPERSVPVPEGSELMVEAMKQILQQVAPSIHYEHPRFDDALWLGSRFVELLPIPINEKHELLAMQDPLKRLSGVRQWLEAFSKRKS